MLKNNHINLYTTYRSIIFLCFSLFFLVLPTYTVQAATSYTPPVGYPMGAATNVTGFAGGTITFNSNDIDSLQGQFFAKTFTSSGTAGGSSIKYLKNYAHDSTANLTDADYAKVNPTMISENITGADMIQWYGNKNSFIF
ncbi:hypothetical protein ACE83Q_06360 [Dellaglioa sp. P0083]|uniref:hypothetical protein n=1 Tax=Dellaglioa kimchii TaxID=3344667 RepID=UPI0038D39BD5